MKSYYPYDSAPFHWYNVADKEYLVFGGAREVQSDCVYQFKDGNFKPIYTVAIFDIRFTDSDMYILAKDQGPDPSFVFGNHSNLVKVNLQDYTEECLGVKGYVYGCVEDSNRSTFVREDWQVKDDGIYISGFYNLGDREEIENTTRPYRVSLTGQSHEKLTP